MESTRKTLKNTSSALDAMRNLLIQTTPKSGLNILLTKFNNCYDQCSIPNAWMNFDIKISTKFAHFAL